LISVIIATKNRSEAIAAYALRGLARQDEADFEVLIWDASDDESTREIVDKQRNLFDTRGIDVVYKRAARPGLASQRNDAVRAARGDVVFFLDDDSEPSSDAVRVVRKYFDDFAWLKGMALPLIDKSPGNAIRKRRMSAVESFYRIHLAPTVIKRVISTSTKHVVPLMDTPGSAEWLSGCCMAFRKDVFCDLQFDERLQRFGGYSWGEDADFSHRVFLHYGEPLIIASEGHVVHHSSPGGRTGSDGVRLFAMHFYNTKIIRDNFKEYGKYGVMSFLWELRIRRPIFLLAGGYRFKDLIRGYLDYRKALREEKV